MMLRDVTPGSMVIIDAARAERSLDLTTRVYTRTFDTNVNEWRYSDPVAYLNDGDVCLVVQVDFPAGDVLIFTSPGVFGWVFDVNVRETHW